MASAARQDDSRGALAKAAMKLRAAPTNSVAALDAGSHGQIEVRNVTKRFGDVIALDNVDFRIPRQSFFALLGPSGCGKTTLLRILAGLEMPDSGQVLVDGRDITRSPPERRPFQMVFQNYALFPHLSVFENVAFGLTTRRSQRPTRQEITNRVGEMLKLVGLVGLEGRLPAQLSGGQAQRVAVARALIRRPDLLLLDEPLSALDRNVRHGLRDELLRIHQELGTTFLLVTHDQDEALSMSQRVALMNRGRIEQLATPEELYRAPATLFTARFIGAGTFIVGHVLNRTREGVSVEVDGHRFLAFDGGVGESASAQVLLRPEELSLAGVGEETLRGRVQTMTYFGSYYEVAVETSIGRLRIRTSTPAAPGIEVGVTWGHRVGVAYPVDSPDGERGDLP